MKSGKIWGITELVHANSSFEFHRIQAKSGGTCSKHKHKHKWNGFFVESGKLIVRIWKETDSQKAGISTHIDETVLSSGDFLMVKPTEYHQFEAVEDTIAFELYWAEFNHDDIIREDHGIVKNYDMDQSENTIELLTEQEEFDESGWPADIF